jgi:hypothetical protein
VLVNEGSRDELQRRVQELHGSYLNFAARFRRGSGPGSKDVE